MSANKHVTIWCDAPECMAWTGGTEHTARAARSYASCEGWVRRNGEDLCPTHAPRAAVPAPKEDE